MKELIRKLDKDAIDYIVLKISSPITT